ncbi:MAG: bifunctional phosphopantothenoylcysteine decarboxylase/phosphopantothenate--cysteine ligase CoaBC [Cryomorphaceae bacterium]|nr:bifunctional phosphopantothenoylcysteine decarboxylase/phosphopantothenate--cysteine ligase CoaBC [Cryomorphaceae bacterium]
MMVLQGKKVLLAVSGSIAAYKAPMLVRLLVKKSCVVRVVLTKSAADFVSPLTLSTLTDAPVEVDFFNRESPEKGWSNHVDMALWADLMIIAPVSSNTLSKMASGQSDNLLLAAFMSAKCPVYFAPAMDLDMYKNEATKENIEKLISRGYHCIPSESGELASGLVGEGRMAEPENIVAFVEQSLIDQQPLRGKTVMVNAGPTREAIDPVRFIGNHASGKMGHALATEAARLGAKVHLILGPTGIPFDYSGMKVTHVESTQEMYEACAAIFPDADLAVFSAAVADYRPAKRHEQKVKKSEANLEISLEPTVDILKTLGHQKKSEQIVIGFALETENAIEYATKKLHTKNADFIVCNVAGEHTGFAHDTNEVTVIAKDESQAHFPLTEKTQLAKYLWNHFIKSLATS